MTREEAIRRMECCRDFLANNYSDMGEPNVTAFNMAIKALEQEPILDKIRAEIDIERFIDKDTKLCKNANASGLEVALQIIDKYKAESERVNCKNTKCDNCVNHNYCDFEPRESE